MPIVVSPIAPISGGGTTVEAPSLRERWVWVDADGDEFELTGFVNGVEVTKGMIGRGAPPLRVRRDVVPGQPGQRTRSKTHDMREMTVPIVVLAESFEDLHHRLEDLVRRLDPIRGGILRRIDRDNNTSDLYCSCTSGLSVAGEGSSGTRMYRALLIFQADDPYWYGQPQMRGFSGSATTSWFPMLPVRLGSSSVIGDAVIVNDGDVESYPVWTVVGPAADLVIGNMTTGKTFAVEFPADLLAGETATIDTRPFVKSVTGPDGTDWRQFLTQRTLWPLQPGPNHLNISMSSTTDSSYVSIAYRKRTLYT